MSVVYVTDYGTSIGVEENRFAIKYKSGMARMIPIETVEGITILGNSQLTTSCIETCLRHGIPVTFMSKGGRYFGRLVSSGHIDAELQRKQASLYNTDFALSLAKIIIQAKLNNQLTVLRRYAHSRGVNISKAEIQMKSCAQHVRTAKTIPEVMGYEGQAAKAYFQSLSVCIEPDFAFKGRSRRPPMDEFNSMISLGYSILMNEIYSVIETKGLNPYFGFIHQDREKHPTLASDMMEEWRAVIVDSMAMSLVNGHEIAKEHFITNTDEPGCFITKDGLKIFISKLDNKLQTRVRYLSYTQDQVSFRTAMLLQADRLTLAIRKGQADLYQPLRIR